MQLHKLQTAVLGYLGLVSVVYVHVAPGVYQQLLADHKPTTLGILEFTS